MKTKTNHTICFTHIFLFLFLSFGFYACVDKAYDLDKDVSLEVNLGGKYLAIPLGTTSQIYLDSLLDIEDDDVLKFLDNGTFALSKIDSIEVKIPEIDPVNITVKGLDIKPVTVKVDNVQLPESFQLGEFSEETSLGVENIDLNIQEMQPINVDARGTLPAVPSIPGQNYPIDIPSAMEVSISNSQTFDFSFQANEKISKVNTIYFGPDEKGTQAEITIQLPQNIDAGKHEIETLSIRLPEGFKLAKAEIDNTGKVNGNTYTVNNYNPGDKKEISFSFYILEMDGVTYPATYSGILDYQLTYKITQGKITSAKESRIQLQLDIPLQLRESNEADIATGPIPVSLSPQKININSTIDDIPEEVGKVKTIYFDPEANEIRLSVDALRLPASLSGNPVQLQFPTSFVFKSSDGLTSANVLELSPEEINTGIEKVLHLESMELDQEVTDRQLILNENITVREMHIQLDATEHIQISEVKKLSDKKIKMTLSADRLKISDAILSTNGITIDVEESKADMDISEKTPKELIAVKTVQFKENPSIKLQLSFEGVPASVKKMKFKDYTITFPDFIEFEGEEIQNHQLILNEEFVIANGYTKELTIKKFNFGDKNPVEDEHIVINDSVTLGGQIYIGQSDLNSSELTDITIKPTLQIAEMELSLVSGRIDPDIDPEDEVLDIGDIPDFLKDDSVVLDIQHPVITVNAANTIGVPVNVSLTMLPMLKGKVIEAGKVDAAISAKPAAILSEPTWSDFWISDSRDGMPATYTYVETPALPDLIRKIPDSISIVMNASADVNALHTIDLSIPEYKLQIKYNISVPLILGQELRIVYRDTLDDFLKDIQDYIDYISEAKILTEIENTVPLEMVCTAEAVDVNKQVLKGISVSAPQKIRAAGWDIQADATTPTLSSFDIILKETVKGELSKLDGLILKITANANSTVAGATVRRNQYLKISAKLKVPGGVNADLNDL